VFRSHSDEKNFSVNTRRRSFFCRSSFELGGQLIRANMPATRGSGYAARFEMRPINDGDWTSTARVDLRCPTPQPVRRRPALEIK
jgi:hypothetical protein